MNNIIVNDGNCGQNNGGYIQYLVNTDNTTNYAVTVQTRWSVGLDTKLRTEVISIPAGGRIYLGCNLVGTMPETIYSRTVVAEI